MVIVDITYAFRVFLKVKSAVARAFSEFIDTRGVRVARIHTDGGGEFIGMEFQDVCRKH